MMGVSDGRTHRAMRKPFCVFSKLKVTVMVFSCGPEFVRSHVDDDSLTSTSPGRVNDAMVGLVEALGARYDADPRLGFMQLGLLGFWGEWHTWPESSLMASADTQEAIVAAFDRSFSTTQLQVRQPRLAPVVRMHTFC